MLPRTPPRPLLAVQVKTTHQIIPFGSNKRFREISPVSVGEEPARPGATGTVLEAIDMDVGLKLDWDMGASKEAGHLYKVHRCQ